MCSSDLSALALTFLASCGVDAAASVAGVYELDTAEMKKAMAVEGADKDPMAKMMMGMLDSMKGSIELKAGGTCELVMSAMGKETKEPGTWKLDGDKLTVTSKKDGKEETKVGKLADGCITVEEGEGPAKMTMVLRKKK